MGSELSVLCQKALPQALVPCSIVACQLRGQRWLFVLQAAALMIVVCINNCLRWCLWALACITSFSHSEFLGETRHLFSWCSHPCY